MNEESEQKVHHGRNIRFFRNAKDIKQEDFADRIGMTQPFVVKIEKQSIIDEAMLLKCANALGISVEMIKEFDPEKMFNGFTYNIDKIENSNAIFSISKDDSTLSPTNHYYPIEKIMELNKQNAELTQKNADLYERMLQSEKEKNAFLEEKVAFLEKMLAEKSKE